MISGGGRDRSELENYTDFDPETHMGIDSMTTMIGCHRGKFVGLNVSNPQTGWHYSWAEDDKRSVMSARMDKKQVVQSDDPEMAVYRELADHDHVDIDSSNTGYPGVVLMKRSAENERMIRADEQSRRDALLRGGDTEAQYRSKATADELAMKGRRFAREDHRSNYATTGTDPESPVVPWRPSDGISS